MANRKEILVERMPRILGLLAVFGGLCAGCSEVRYSLVGTAGSKVGFQQRSVQQVLISRITQQEDLCVFDVRTEKWAVIPHGKASGLIFKESTPISLTECGPDNPLSIHGLLYHAIRKDGAFRLVHCKPGADVSEEVARLDAGKHAPPKLLAVDGCWLIVTERGVALIGRDERPLIRSYPDRRWLARALYDSVTVPPRGLLALIVMPFYPVPW